MLMTVGVTVLCYISLVAFNVIFKILLKFWSRAKSKENIYEEFAILLLFYSILVQKHRACKPTLDGTNAKMMQSVSLFSAFIVSSELNTLTEI